MTRLMTNKQQFECLVRLMTENEDIARGLVKSGKDVKCEVKNRWARFTEELNSLGEPIRDTDGWIKVWTDLKYKIRKKLIRNKKELTGTGGGPNRMMSFSAIEESIIDILNLNTTVNPPGTAFGLNENREENVELEENVEIQVVQINGNVADSENNINRKRANKNPIINFNRKRFELLKTQTVTQENLYKVSEENNKLLRKIYEQHKETNKLLKQTTRIKQEKLELYKTELKLKRAHRIDKLKVKVQILELQREQVSVQQGI